jgi:hypothetical protein
MALGSRPAVELLKKERNRIAQRGAKEEGRESLADRTADSWPTALLG